MGRHKDSFIHWLARTTARANLGRAIEFLYGTRTPNGRRFARREQDATRKWAQYEVGNENPKSVNTYYQSSSIMRHRARDFESVYNGNWEDAVYKERNIPVFLEKIDIIKSKKELVDPYLSTLAASNKTICKLRGWNQKPPTVEEAFYILMKLNIYPSDVWPDELREHEFHIHILSKICALFVRREITEFNAEEVLFLDTCLSGGGFSNNEWCRSVENFLQPILKTICVNPSGEQKAFRSLFNPENGIPSIKIDDNTFLTIKDGDKTRHVFWKEFESHLKRK